jgi:hypothetical protein
MLRSFKKVNPRGRKPMGDPDAGSGKNSGRRSSPAQYNDAPGSGFKRTRTPKRLT